MGDEAMCSFMKSISHIYGVAAHDLPEPLFFLFVAFAMIEPQKCNRIIRAVGRAALVK